MRKAIIGSILAVSLLAFVFVLQNKSPIPGPSSQFAAISGSGSGLVALYTLDGNANDSAGGNNGTSVGGLTYTGGKIGQAISLGGSDYIDAGSGLDMGSRDFSLSAWFKTSDIANTIAGKGGTYALGKRYFVGVSSDCGGKIKGEIDDDSVKKFVCSSAALNDNTWHHVTLVREGTSLRLYEDGQQNTAPTDITGYGSLTSSRPFTIGSLFNESSGAQSDFLTGSVDDVRVYNRALSASEVSEVYALGGGGGTTSSVSYYDLAPNKDHFFVVEDGQTATLNDIRYSGDFTSSNNLGTTRRAQILTFVDPKPLPTNSADKIYFVLTNGTWKQSQTSFPVMSGTTVLSRHFVIRQSTKAGPSKIEISSKFHQVGGGPLPLNVQPRPWDSTPPTILNSTLTITKSGAGTVSGSGISCGTNCQVTLNNGTSVTLTATPSTGSTFTGWSGGGCSGTGTCTLVISSNTSVTAIFNATVPTPINGSCSTILNTCTTGTFSDATDTATNRLWSCIGTNGGTTASCSQPITTPSSTKFITNNRVYVNTTGVNTRNNPGTTGTTVLGTHTTNDQGSIIGGSAYVDSLYWWNVNFDSVPDGYVAEDFLTKVATQTGNTITAVSPSRADVGIAYAAAVDGDTIVIPAGTVEWTSQLAVTKAVTFQGAGIGQTIIKDSISSGPQSLFSVTLVANKTTRITGIEFQVGATISAGPTVDLFGSHIDSRRFRFDHSKFDNLYSSAIRINTALGVFDHNILLGRAGRNTLAHVKNSNWDGRTGGNGIWDNAGPDFGSENSFFFEDNTITGTSLVYYTSLIDAQAGGRYVFRNNTVVRGYVEGHGSEAQYERSTHAVEVYNNTFDQSNVMGLVTYFRGGSGLVYGNTILNTQGTNAPLALLHNRMSDSLFQPIGGADGRNPWDVNNPGLYTGTVTNASNLTVTVNGTNWSPNQWEGNTIRKTSGRAVTSVNRNGSVITVTALSHGFSNGASVSLFGADQQEYNAGYNGITVIDGNTFSANLGEPRPTTPATGVIKAVAGNHFSEIKSNTSNTLTFSGSLFGGSRALNFAVGDTFEINKVTHGMDQIGRTCGSSVPDGATPARPPGWNNQINSPWYQWYNNFWSQK